MTGIASGGQDHHLDLKTLAAKVHAGMPGATFTVVGGAFEGARGEPGECHANAAAWVVAHSGFRIVPGWIPVPYETLPNRVRFHSHSLVEDSAGRLLDVTLTAEQALAHRFIRHPGPSEAFYAAVADQGLPSIEHVLAPDPIWPL